MSFPAIVPTKLRLTLGSYGVRQGDWNGVWEEPQLLGSIETETALELSYENIANDVSVLFLSSHLRSGSGYFSMQLPVEVVAGVVSPGMAAYILDPFGLSWVWSEPPRHTAVMPGFSTVEVKLIAELR